ncbi:type III secretion protein J [Noviherbaspirillum humi]|uniref:Lipoprotein n=1 Tax=Noviherbaspirillum humi TaxID=1688639 RepID=A0A239JYB7_9BURK|nr:type III secretion inner membrane ring lipoprotein SctJ [Noviherbaspirillum humi]SNT10423.1 type III secretion protein J [Noviherbaspirillum humi]
MRTFLDPIRQCLSWVLLLALLCGCSKQLYEDLSEQDANQIVSVLRMEGIDSDKVQQKDKRWIVKVPDSEFARAVVLMKEKNLPAFGYEGLSKMFKKDSLLVTPLEERARLMLAVSQELERTLRYIDGVLDARVHVVIPVPNQLSDKPQPSSASVFIKVRHGVDLQPELPKIRAIVLHGVEGLQPDALSISLFSASPSETSKNAETREGGLAWQILAGASVVLFVLLAVSMFFWPRRDGPIKSGAWLKKDAHNG